MRRAVLAIALMLVAFGCIGTSPSPPKDNGTDTGNAITREMCEQYKGHWNECGSACRGAPEGTACTMNCVFYCECGGIAGFGCPPGYICTDYLPKGAADAMGICKKVSE